MNDKQGRPYAKVEEVKVGTKVQVDGDFGCVKPWSIHEVMLVEGGLCIPCVDGWHGLDGQLNDEGTHYVGIYKMEA